LAGGLSDHYLVGLCRLDLGCDAHSALRRTLPSGAHSVKTVYDIARCMRCVRDTRSHRGALV